MQPGGMEEQMLVSRGYSRDGASVPAETLLRWGRDELERAGIAVVESRWLLEWALGEPLGTRTDVGIRAAEKYRSAIFQRRAHIPLQHITREMTFRYLTLRAGPGVFIVRPETEMLVDLALETLGAGNAKVADLCAGSGAIGLALASERKDTCVTMVEINPIAGRYLEANARGTAPFAPGSTVAIRMEDATRGLSGWEESLDMVVSNPPYVGVADAPEQPEALADPQTALYGGGEDGLVTPRGIVTRAHALLRGGGTLLMEHGEKQGAALVDHAANVGFSAGETLEDLTGRPRFLKAVKQ